MVCRSVHRWPSLKHGQHFAVRPSCDGLTPLVFSQDERPTEAHTVHDLVKETSKEPRRASFTLLRHHQSLMDQTRSGRLSLKRPYEPHLKQKLIGIDDHSRRLRIGREFCNSLVCRSKSLFEPCQFWLTNEGSSKHPFETNCPTDEWKPYFVMQIMCFTGEINAAEHRSLQHN